QGFATGNVPFAVAAADVNGDGLPDLLAANERANTVSVLLAIPPAGDFLTIGTGTATGTIIDDDPGAIQTTASPLSYTSGSGAVAIDPGLTLSDAHGPNLVGATVALTTGNVASQDAL